MSVLTEFFGIVWSAFDTSINLFGYMITFKQVFFFTLIVGIIFKFFAKLFDLGA